MNQPLHPTLLIKTWLDIATASDYPEAQEIACKKLYMCFDDVSQAELYLEMEKIKLTSELLINSASQLIN